MNAKIVLDKEDYYGDYVIKKSMFSGPQSNWQYDNFRFTIKGNDSIYFYVTSGTKVLNVFKGKIETVAPYESHRLILRMESPTHHSLLTNPTTYRSKDDFYLVFYSPKFGNMFFTKGKWKVTKCYVE